MKNFTYLWALVAALLLFSCQSDDSTDGLGFEPTTVIVGLNTGATTNHVFNLINTTGQMVDNVHGLSYKSGLAADQLDYLKQQLDAQPYIDATTWSSHPFVDEQDHQVKVNLRLHAMHNTAFQAQHLQAMQQLELSDISSTPVIVFHVPAGQEMQWAAHFRTMNHVAWAELNYYRELILE